MSSIGETRQDITHVGFSGDSQRLAAASGDGRIMVCNLKTAQRADFPDKVDGLVHDLVFSPDGRLARFPGRLEARGNLAVAGAARGRSRFRQTSHGSAWPRSTRRTPFARQWCPSTRCCRRRWPSPAAGPRRADIVGCSCRKTCAGRHHRPRGHRATARGERIGF
jgi:hypothetical protein